MLRACLLLLLLTACSGPVAYSVAGDLDPALVRDAARQWSDACGRELFYQVPSGGVRVYRGVCILPGTAGESNGDYVLICGEPTVALYAHELGHVLGLDHRPTGIMAARFDPDVRVTSSDCP
jgi:hypothetical protein